MMCTCIAAQKYEFKGISEVGICDYSKYAHIDAKSALPLPEQDVGHEVPSSQFQGKVFPTRRFNRKFGGAPYCYEDFAQGGIHHAIRWFKSLVNSFMERTTAAASKGN
jgi:hypothetical protein